MSNVEKQSKKWYKEFDPASAYLDGINECAGRFPVPSKKNLDRAESKLKNILKKATNQVQRRIFKSYLTSLRFNEPYMVPSRATNAFFAHLFKKRNCAEHLESLAVQVGGALDAYSELLDSISLQQVPAGLLGPR